MKILYKAHLLNIDTALGAVVCSNFVAKTMVVALPWVVNLALFTSVLIIYNFDHLADAHKISGKALTDRHQFYKDKYLGLKIFQIVLMIFGMVLIYFLPMQIVKAGSIVVLAVILYFAILEVIPVRLVFFKEFLVALVYASAIFLAPLIMVKEISLTVALLFGQIFILALMNLLIFSWFDRDVDVKEGHPSLMNIISENDVPRLVIVLFITEIFLGSLYLRLQSQWSIQLTILVMSLILLTLYFKPERLQKNKLARPVGDLVFLLPVFFILFL
jgi:4-hydroxybenzoate polyprenyltransferase